MGSTALSSCEHCTFVSQLHEQDRLTFCAILSLSRSPAALRPELPLEISDIVISSFEGSGMGLPLMLSIDM
jgi:hypothetical protein